MTTILSHVSMVDMQLVRSTFAFIALMILPLFSFAFEASVSIYIFEHKGTNVSKKIRLEDRNTPLHVDAPWFDWKCFAQKQYDGVNLQCEKGEEIAETKIFCYKTGGKETRYLKMNKGPNFVSFETKCALSASERRRSVKTQKIKKTAIPESERIPLPTEPELEVIPPALSEPAAKPEPIPQPEPVPVPESAPLPTPEPTQQ